MPSREWQRRLAGKTPGMALAITFSSRTPWAMRVLAFGIGLTMLVAAKPGETRHPRCPQGTTRLATEIVALCQRRVDGQSVLHGPAVRWHETSGALREIGRYNEGEKHGRWRSWHPNGTLATDGTFVRGKRVGPHADWNPDGSPRWLRTYDAQGELHGVEKWWHVTGEPLGVAEYVHGQHVGTWKQWRADGMLILYEEFDCVGHLIGLPVDGHAHGMNPLAHATRPLPDVVCPRPTQ